MASTQSSCLPKAVRRIYPSPLGPKPTPGVPTTLASYNICSKNRQEPYVVRGFQPDVWSVHTAVHFQPGCFQSFFHGAGVVHIVVNRFFYLPSAFCGVDGFGGTLGNVACTIKLGALAAVPQFVEEIRSPSSVAAVSSFGTTV